MKKFLFKYDKILQLRIDKENQIKNTLAKINKLILVKEDDLEQVIHKNDDFLKQVEDTMKSGILVSDLQAISVNKEYMQKKIKKTKHELELFKKERISIQKELVEANRQRKVMEKLREKEVEEYKELEAQEESKVVDQIVTYQSTMTRGEE